MLSSCRRSEGVPLQRDALDDKDLLRDVEEEFCRVQCRTVAGEPAGRFTDVEGYWAGWRPVRVGLGFRGATGERSLPVRKVRSAALSRHIPVRARVSTIGGPLLLESGLEHELVTWLDHRRDVEWIVAQPVRLTWSDGISHCPDILAVNSYGQVQVWDARPAARQDDAFDLKAARTGAECERVGWSYSTFAGLPAVASSNLRWIAGARRIPEWLEAARPALMELFTAGPRPLRDVLASDDGRGFRTRAFWHLVWTEDLVMELDELWDEDTLVVARGGAEA